MDLHLSEHFKNSCNLFSKFADLMFCKMTSLIASTFFSVSPRCLLRRHDRSI